MALIQTPARRRAARAARWLTATLGGLAVLAAGAAAQAQPVTAAAGGRALVPVSARAASTPAPVPLNTTNWSGSAGFGSRPPAWYEDSSGVIHLQGAVHQTSPSGTGANVIGTLPAAARPAQTVGTILHTFAGTILHTFAGTYSGLFIDTNGTILILGAHSPAVTDFSFVSLEGITYRRSRPGNPIAVNTVNWNAMGGFGSRSPAWYKDQSGVVHLQGAVGQIDPSGTGANLIGTLPAAVRPASTVYTIVGTSESQYADLAIEPNGTINLINPRPPATQDYSFVSLESITYRPGGVGTAIPLNTANWSGSAGFDSRGPAWFKDRWGVVHLEGAVTQTSPSGAGANLIGTLPAAAAPRHTVYTIVHTFNGTYADLAIEPNGQLALIAPRSPMVQDYSFVSLESITYRR